MIVRRLAVAICALLSLTFTGLSWAQDEPAGKDKPAEGKAMMHPMHGKMQAMLKEHKEMMDSTIKQLEEASAASDPAKMKEGIDAALKNLKAMREKADEARMQMEKMGKEVKAAVGEKMKEKMEEKEKEAKEEKKE